MTHAPQGHDGTSSSLASQPTRSTMRKVALAGMSGTLIEIYDFVIYGTAAALVFPQTFFPALGSAAGIVASFATLGVAFVARPVGGLIFGHFGDRLGRKKTLVVTLLMMGIATALVGILPTTAQIGVAAPILLVILRFTQGLAAGGEWAGAALFVSEYAPATKRATWTIFPQLGGTLAVSLANLTFLITGFGMSNEAFVSWGWRLPFISSILLVAIGLWIRVSLEETPAFKETIVKKDVKTALPFAEAIKMQYREILLCAGIALTVFTLQYLGNTYMVSIAANSPELGRTFALVIGVFSGLVLSAGVISGALVADRIGRKKTIGFGNVAAALWGSVMFILIAQNSRVTYALAVLVAMFIAGWVYGPIAAFLSEMFQTRYRYTAVGLSYNLSGIIGGGVIPLIAGPVIVAYGPTFFGLCVGALSVIGAVCTLAVRETKSSELRYAGQAESAGRKVNRTSKATEFSGR
jgi:MFS family permease